MFKEMGVKTYYIDKSLEDSKRATVLFQGPVNTCYDIFVNPETKPIVEASGHIYEETIIIAGFLNDDFMIYFSKCPQTFHSEIMWTHENMKADIKKTLKKKNALSSSNDIT